MPTMPNDVICEVVKIELGEDIRKFPLTNEELRYDELLLMIERIHNLTKEQVDNMHIKYKDDDGDFISIVEDSDIIFALQSNKTLRIKLSCKSAGSSLISSKGNQELIDEIKEMKLMMSELAQKVEKIQENEKILKSIQNGKEFDPLENKNSQKEISKSIPTIPLLSNGSKPVSQPNNEIHSPSNNWQNQQTSAIMKPTNSETQVSRQDSVHSNSPFVPSNMGQTARHNLLNKPNSVPQPGPPALSMTRHPTPQGQYGYPQLPNSGMPPSMQNPGMPPSMQNPGMPPSMQNHGMPPSMQNPGMPPSMQNSGMPPSMQNPGMPPSMQNPGMPPSMQNSGMPPSMQNPGMPPSMQNSGMPPSSVPNSQAGVNPSMTNSPSSTASGGIQSMSNSPSSLNQGHNNLMMNARLSTPGYISPHLGQNSGMKVLPQTPTPNQQNYLPPPQQNSMVPPPGGPTAQLGGLPSNSMPQPHHSSQGF